MGSCHSFLSGSVVKNLPARQEPQVMGVGSLGQEDPLEEDMATHSSILTWRIPQTEESGGSPWSPKEPAMTEQITIFTFTTYYHVLS